MIKFGDSPEVYEQSNNSAKGYEIIKPSRDMSDSEMMRFIENEIGNSKEKSWDGYFDAGYLDWAEEEIDIDHHISDELLSLAKRFNSYEWWSASDDERYEWIEEFSNELASSLGVADRPKIITSDSIGDSCGCYCNSDNTITLNKSYLQDGPETLNTLVHEMRHAYQYTRSKALETPNDFLIKENLDSYIVPIQMPNGEWLNFIDYYYQYVEVDARVFADIFSEAIK